MFESKEAEASLKTLLLMFKDGDAYRVKLPPQIILEFDNKKARWVKEFLKTFKAHYEKFVARLEQIGEAGDLYNYMMAELKKVTEYSVVSIATEREKELRTIVLKLAYFFAEFFAFFEVGIPSPKYLPNQYHRRERNGLFLRLILWVVGELEHLDPNVKRKYIASRIAAVLDKKSKIMRPDQINIFKKVLSSLQ